MFQPPRYAVQPAPIDNQVSIAKVLQFLRRRWPYIVGVTAAFAVIATLVVLQTKAEYTARASVAVQAQKGQVVNVATVTQSLTPDDATMATQATILKSTKLVGQLIDKLKLDQDPEFSPWAAAAGKPAFSLLSPSTWFGSRPTVEGKLTPIDVARRRATLVEIVSSAFLVQPSDKSFVINIAATSHDPMKAATLANTLADLYIQDGIEAKFEANRRASSYLQARVEELRVQAVQADRAAESYRAANGLASAGGSGPTIDTQQLSELNSQLIIARSERAAKEAELSQIRSLSSGRGDLESSGLVVNSPLIQRLREQESEVQRNLANLQSSFGPNHPKIINANAELRDLRSKIMDEVRKLASSTANAVAIARAREGTLSGGLSSIEGRVNRGGAAEVRLRELQREADASKSVYETFLNRLKETTQQVDVQSADSRIVSPALIPMWPSAPRTSLTIMLSIVAGLLFGVLLALLMEQLDNTIRSADTVEQLGGGVTLAALPVVAGNPESPERIVIERPQSMVAEALRTLRSALALSDVDNPPKLVMLTSSVPGEGKTFTSVGLARVSAQAGNRTLLIDADMRHPRVHSALGMENGPGLVAVLSGQSSFEDACTVDTATGLTVLSAGRGVVNPPDLLRSAQMRELLTRLRARYDFIVIDTPPFVPMTDSQVLSAMVDKLLLVVRWGHTPLPVVHNVIKQIRRVDAPLVGTVMSRVHFSRHATYGYGDYGYHYSRYGAYYGTAE